MPEQSRRHDHARVITTLINLQVSPAGESHVHLHQDLTAFQTGNRHLLDFYVLFAIEDSRCHLAFQRFSHSVPGWIITFIESGPGCEARCNAPTACCSGKRCVTSRAKSISPLNTSCTFSSCRSTEAL